jgi:hypothetical protein
MPTLALIMLSGSPAWAIANTGDIIIRRSWLGGSKLRLAAKMCFGAIGFSPFFFSGVLTFSLDLLAIGLALLLVSYLICFLALSSYL